MLGCELARVSSLQHPCSAADHSLYGHVPRSIYCDFEERQKKEDAAKKEIA